MGTLLRGGPLPHVRRRFEWLRSMFGGGQDGGMYEGDEQFAAYVLTELLSTRTKCKKRSYCSSPS